MVRTYESFASISDIRKEIVEFARRTALSINDGMIEAYRESFKHPENYASTYLRKSEPHFKPFVFQELKYLKNLERSCKNNDIVMNVEFFNPLELRRIERYEKWCETVPSFDDGRLAMWSEEGELIPYNFFNYITKIDISFYNTNLVYERYRIEFYKSGQSHVFLSPVDPPSGVEEILQRAQGKGELSPEGLSDYIDKKLLAKKEG